MMAASLKIRPLGVHNPPQTISPSLLRAEQSDPTVLLDSKTHAYMAHRKKCYHIEKGQALVSFIVRRAGYVCQVICYLN